MSREELEKEFDSHYGFIKKYGIDSDKSYEATRNYFVLRRLSQQASS